MENGFRRLHPYILFLYYMSVLVFLMYFNHPVFLLTAIVLLIGINVTHDKGKALRKWALPLIIMSIIFAAINPLLVSRGTHILFYLGNRQITLEAVMFGLTMSLMLIAVIILFVSFNLILNGNKFLYVFSKIIPRTAFLIMLSIRFVPLLKGRYDEINAVYRMRGMTVTEGKWRHRAKNGMNMIQTLLTWSLEEAIQTADSMQARGYGTGEKTSYQLYKMMRHDWIVLSFISICMIVGIGFGLLGYGKIVIYPSLGPLQFYPFDWLVFICMLGMIALPMIMEGVESLRWKS